MNACLLTCYLLFIHIYLHDRHGNPQVLERMIDDRIPGSGS